MKQLFTGSRGSRDKVDRKISELMNLLANSGMSGKELEELHRLVDASFKKIETYKEYLSEHPREAKELRELEIVISRVPKTRAGRFRAAFPNPIRMIISILLITLGFAMIVMPAPPYFEMYTIFYFNENDGFTLMDLISLIIVFCGIFTLIMTMQKHRRE